MHHLKLTRPINLLLIAFLLVVIKYGFLEAMYFPTALDTMTFSLLVIATVCIAAGGNIINDIYDVETDKINKPSRVLIGTKISERSASTFFIILTFIGVLAGFVVSNLIGHPSLAAVFVIIAALLYGYALWFKRIFLVGNLLVSLIVAMLLLNFLLFDLYPTIEYVQEDIVFVSVILTQYALFAFWINLIREIIKDLQDINGDRKGGRNTLPIAIGRQRTVYVAFALTVCLLIALVYHIYMNIYSAKPLMLYFLLAIVGPLLYVLVRIWSAEKPTDFKQISTFLKIIMFLGICSLLLYPYVL